MNDAPAADVRLLTVVGTLSDVETAAGMGIKQAGKYTLFCTYFLMLAQFSLLLLALSVISLRRKISSLSEYKRTLARTDAR